MEPPQRELLNILKMHEGELPEGDYPTFTLSEGVATLTLGTDTREIRLAEPYRCDTHGIFTLTHVFKTLGLIRVELPGKSTLYELVLSSHELTTIVDGCIHRKLIST